MRKHRSTDKGFSYTHHYVYLLILIYILRVGSISIPCTYALNINTRYLHNMGLRRYENSTISLCIYITNLFRHFPRKKLSTVSLAVINIYLRDSKCNFSIWCVGTLIFYSILIYRDPKWGSKYSRNENNWKFYYDIS